MGRDITNNCNFLNCPPTARPTPSPFQRLPARPTPKPAEFPLRNTFSGDNDFGPCQADKAGLFGWGNENERAVLDYKYELETKPGSPADGLLLFTLQRAMMESSLPALFPDQCEGSHGLNRDRERRLRQLLVVGVSAYPAHEITNRKHCFVN